MEVQWETQVNQTSQSDYLVITQISEEKGVLKNIYKQVSITVNQLINFSQTTVDHQFSVTRQRAEEPVESHRANFEGLILEMVQKYALRGFKPRPRRHEYLYIFWQDELFKYLENYDEGFLRDLEQAISEIVLF